MGDLTFAELYRAWARVTHDCPIEAGFIGRLADHECRHGRLAFDRTAPCGCWPEERGALVNASARTTSTPTPARRAA